MYYFSRSAFAGDLDVFDRVQRAHFDYGSQAVTTGDSGFLWAYCLVRTKHHLKASQSHNKSTSSTRKAIQCNHDISFDVGFVMQSSVQMVVIEQDLMERFRESVQWIDKGIEAPTFTRPETEQSESA
jgi:hypothetical protein